MKGARKPQRPAARKAASAATAATPATGREPFVQSLGTLALWVLLFVPPFLVSPSAKEAFRLPKLLLSGW